MTTVTFAALALDLWQIFSLAIGAASLVALLLLARRIANVFDPALTTVIAVGIDVGVLTVLFVGRQLSSEYYACTLLAYVAVLVGLSLVPLPSAQPMRRHPLTANDRIIFAAGLNLLYFALSAVTLSSRGILNAARETDVVSQTASSNLTVMLTMWLSIAGTYAAIDVIRSPDICRFWRACSWFSLLLYFVLGALSGSKLGWVLTLTGVLCVWGHLHRPPSTRSFARQLLQPRMWLIALTIIVAVLLYFWMAVGMLYGTWDPADAGARFAGRMLQNADGIYMASNGNGFYIPSPPSLLTFIDPTLTKLLPIEPAASGYSYGQDIFERSNGFVHLEAPNAKPVVILVVYLGPMSVAGGFLLGFALGWLRRAAMLMTAKVGFFAMPLFAVALAPLTDIAYGYSLIRAMLVFSLAALLPFLLLNMGNFFRRSEAGVES